MIAPKIAEELPHASADAAIQAACARIAPTWPLDRFIAVNPLWGMIDRPLPEVAGQLRALSGATLLMPRAWYRGAYQEGRFGDAHLQAAIDESGSPRTLADLRALLDQAEPSLRTRQRVVDVADAERDLTHEVAWRSFVLHSVSQWCAGYFDDGQASLGPSREGGLYASWRRYAIADRSPGLSMGATAFRSLAAALPAQADALTSAALTALGVPPEHRETYLWGLLLDQNGWASWCAYRRWTAQLDGRDDGSLADLLAIRLAWEWLLLQLGGAPRARRWRQAIAEWPEIDAAAASFRADDWLFQAALEIAWREPVLRALPTAGPHEQGDAQAVFCIDVRSEVFRRALEARGVLAGAPKVQTLGFAGFFGVPIDYQPLGATATRPQLPGLLAPRLRAADVGVSADDAAARSRQLDEGSLWQRFKGDPVSTFAFVEALGLTYARELWNNSVPTGSVERRGLRESVDARRKPRLLGAVSGAAIDVDGRADLAAGMLRGMSLTRDFARVVLLVGHGSASRNNPHAAGLDCGACCGQTGEVNARVAAALLNDPAVRSALVPRGIAIPASTWFVAALHNTTTDEVPLYDLDELPASHRGDVEALTAELAAAGAAARAERAARFDLAPRGRAGTGAANDLHAAMLARSTDWAQVRPEWGLANNAAFLVAPREQGRHLNLEGRAFLHEYRHAEDERFKVLELIMTAPMVVTHWINFQYYASTVDNLRYGSGNKVLHNVVGGHVGVFEGNGGDLRIGLPLQSLHDGERWVHTPLRLTVFLAAPRDAIDGVLNKHAHVRALVTNGWVSLFQLDDDGSIHALRRGRWHPATPAEGGHG